MNTAAEMLLLGISVIDYPGFGFVPCAHLCSIDEAIFDVKYKPLLEVVPYLTIRMTCVAKLP